MNAGFAMVVLAQLELSCFFLIFQGTTQTCLRTHDRVEMFDFFRIFSLCIENRGIKADFRTQRHFPSMGATFIRVLFGENQKHKHTKFGH